MSKAIYVSKIERNLKELSEEIENIKIPTAKEVKNMTLEQLKLINLGTQLSLDSIKFFNQNVRNVCNDCEHNIEE